jgi:hypothetical protein
LLKFIIPPNKKALVGTAALHGIGSNQRSVSPVQRDLFNVRLPHIKILVKKKVRISHLFFQKSDNFIDGYYYWRYHVGNDGKV